MHFLFSLKLLYIKTIKKVVEKSCVRTGAGVDSEYVTNLSYEFKQIKKIKKLF